MDKTNETTPRREGQNEVIVLGVASIETMGSSQLGEVNGIQAGAGITDE